MAKKPASWSDDSPTARWYWGLPYLAVALFALAMLAVVWLLQRQGLEVERSGMARDMHWAEQTMRLRMEASQEFLQLLARDAREGKLTRDAFLVRGSQYIANNPEVTTIVLVGTGGEARWIAPFDATDWLPAETLKPPQWALMIQAETAEKGVYGHPRQQGNQPARLDYFVPFLRGTEAQGGVLAVFDVGAMMRHLVPPWFTDKYLLSITDSDGRVLARNTSLHATDDALADVIRLSPSGIGLTMRAIAYRSAPTLPRGMPIALIVGLSLLVAASLWYLNKSVARRVQVERERDRLFNLSLDMLCITNTAGYFRRTSPAFLRVLGYPPEELAGQSLMDFVHPDDKHLTWQALRDLEWGQPRSFEARYRCADGSYKWLIWSMNPVADEGLLYGVAHDITDRKQAEDALRDEYAFRKAMEESLVTGMRAIDFEGRITYVNPAFCRMVGLPPEKLIGCLPPFPYWPPEDLPAMHRNIQMILAGEAPPEGIVMRAMRADGERFDVRLYVSPLIDAAGTHTGWMASITDITEPMRARAELLASHNRFVTVLDGLDALVYVADAQSGEMLFVNQIFRKVFGNDSLGRDCWQVTADLGLDIAHLARDPRRIGADEVPCELFDGEIQHAGNDHWYHLRDRAIRWVDGRVARMVIATDITERHQIAEITARQQERLDHTSRLIAMGEMASSLAHELNQPLSAIANYAMGCVKRLQSSQFNREELLAALEKTNLQAERAGKIIRRMREFVRKSEPHREPVRLHEIVEETLGLAEIEARKSGVAIFCEVSPALPPVFVDRIMIEQVLFNLLRNGIEAMAESPKDRRELHVVARLSDAQRIQVEIRDRGMGFRADDAERLFSPFYTTKPQGLGMGLNICRSIIEYHHGHLWATPLTEGGSAFTFTLPLQEAAGD